MPSCEALFSPERLNALFPPERTDEFFEALFGGAEDGAYDIRLSLRKVTESRVDFFFELHRRGSACLACNLTHGLPQVFARHPVINVKGLAAEVAALAGWPDKAADGRSAGYEWALDATEEVSDALHVVPFSVIRKG